MHPILFHLGSIVVPAYGALTAAGVLVALFLSQRAAMTVAAPGQSINRRRRASFRFAEVAR